MAHRLRNPALKGMILYSICGHNGMKHFCFSCIVAYSLHCVTCAQALLTKRALFEVLMTAITELLLIITTTSQSEGKIGFEVMSQQKKLIYSIRI